MARAGKKMSELMGVLLAAGYNDRHPGGVGHGKQNQVQPCPIALAKPMGRLGYIVEFACNHEPTLHLVSSPPAPSLVHSSPAPPSSPPPLHRRPPTLAFASRYFPQQMKVIIIMEVSKYTCPS